MRLTTWILGVLLCLITIRAEASIFINEVLADPAAIGGDANSDGIVSVSNDEFIELVNTADTTVDISGWQISDTVKNRHIFPNATFIDPYSFFVVFGGGTSNLIGIKSQVGSTFTLSLNNDGDTITLFDTNNQIIDRMIYGTEGGKDTSLTRKIDGELSDYILHSSHPLSQSNLFSPGTTVSGQTQLVSTAVPEPKGPIGFVLGFLGLIFLKKASFFKLYSKCPELR